MASEPDADVRPVRRGHPALRAWLVFLLVAGVLGAAAVAVVAFSRDLNERGTREACETEAAEIAAAVAAYRARHGDALPPADGPAALARALEGAKLIGEARVEHAGPEGWAYDPATGRVDDSGCSP